MKNQRIVSWAMYVSLSILFLTASALIAQEQCLKDAWSAFNKKDYGKAISFSNDCIDNFGKAATRIQKELDSIEVPLPPTMVVSDAEKDRIFKRGLLNDVATAYWIKGRSSEYLYRQGGAKKDEYKKMAEDAYKETCKYKHGRTWDPKGWFWSPFEAASDRLPLK